MNPVTPEDRYTERTCSLCGCRFHDSTASYCRPCTNQYYAWRYHQRKAGLPTTVTEYRRVTDKLKPNAAAAIEARLKVCAVCDRLHRNANSRTYCPACQSAYIQWGKLRRQAGLPAMMAEFRIAIDNGSVVPRYPGEEHLGKVVRSI